MQPKNPFDTTYCFVCRRPIPHGVDRCPGCAEKPDPKKPDAAEQSSLITSQPIEYPRQGLAMDLFMIAAMVAEVCQIGMMFKRLSSTFGIKMVFSPGFMAFYAVPIIYGLVIWDVWTDDDRFGKPAYILGGINGFFDILSIILCHGDVNITVTTIALIHAVILVGIWRRYGSPANAWKM